MRRIYACWLEFADPISRDPLTARALVKRWVGAHYGAWPTGAADHWEPTGDARVRWRAIEHDDDAAFELEWIRAHDGDPTLGRRIRTQIVATPNDGRIVVAEWLESHDRKVRGRPPTVADGPELVGELVESIRCVDGGWAVRAVPHRADSERAPELDAFVRGGRRLPVVLVAAGTDGVVRADAAGFARALVGLAHIVILVDAPAVHAVTRELGSGRGVEPGGVRLLWPEWRSGDTPGRHRSWRAEDVAGRDGPRARVLETLRELIFDAATLRLDDDPRVSALARAESARDLTERRADLTRLQHAVAEDRAVMHELVDEYQEELRRADDEVYRLEEALEREHEHRVRAENAYLLLATGPEDPRHLEPEVRSLAEAVRLARARLAHLVVLPEAERSARDWQYDRADLVWADLKRLEAVAADWSAGTLRGDFATEARRWGLDWVRDISDDARHKFGTEYRRTYHGAPIMLGPHLRRSGRQILRVYCYLDADRRLLVIGHVGGHLGDRST